MSRDQNPQINAQSPSLPYRPLLRYPCDKNLRNFTFFDENKSGQHKGQCLKFQNFIPRYLKDNLYFLFFLCVCQWEIRCITNYLVHRRHWFGAKTTTVNIIKDQ